MAESRRSAKGLLAVDAVVVCEDVRKEANGKEILLGVFSGGVLLPSVPATIVLAFWVHFDAKETGEVALQFRLMGPARAQLALLDARMEVAKAGPGAIFVPPVPVHVQVPGTLSLEMNESGGRWQTLKTVGVEVGLVPGAQPPS